MFYIRLWTIILPIVLNCIYHQRAECSIKTVERAEKFALGGFVGCLLDDVCMRDEFCIDDHLFGKCAINSIEYSSQPVFTADTLHKLESILETIFVDEINWRDLRVQCLLRTIILESESDEDVDEKVAKKICGFDTDATAPSAIRDEEKKPELELDKKGDVSPVFVEKPLFVPYRSNDLSVYEQFKYPNQVSTGLKNKVNFRWNSLGDNDGTGRMSPIILDDGTDHNYPRVHGKPGNLQFEFPGLKSIESLFNQEQTLNEPIKYDVPHSSPHNLDYLEVEQSDRNQIVPLKRRYQLTIPYEMGPRKPLVRSWIWAKFMRRSLDVYEAEQFLQELSRRLHLSIPIADYFLDRTGNVLYFRVPKTTGVTADSVVLALKQGKGNFDGYYIEDVGFGRGTPLYQPVRASAQPKNYTFTLIICLSIIGCILLLCIVYAVHLCRRKLDQAKSTKEMRKAFLPDMEGGMLANVTSKTGGLVKKLRNKFESKISGKKAEAMQKRSQVLTESIQPCTEPTNGQPAEVFSANSKQMVTPERSGVDNGGKSLKDEHKDSLTSRNSSITSGSSEPVACGIDSTTGHLILSYMEEFLCDENRTNADWDAVNSYEAEESTPCEDAQRPENLMRNRRSAPLPYEQSRVRLRTCENEYINASLLYDHSPRNPIYIATPSPMLETLADFWQMIWEQSTVVIVCLESANEIKMPITDSSTGIDSDDSVQYWPNEGSKVYGKFEVHLVSEHSWCENYVVRSFYLKKMDTSETRTVTQFHYLTWQDDKLKADAKYLLEFRRKVNRSFRGMMSPLVIHCCDGSGRTGTYMLLDLVLNRIAKGVKEINIAASLEHLRDQRQRMVETKEQYEFVFTAVAQEVDAMLKTTG